MFRGSRIVNFLGESTRKFAIGYVLVGTTILLTIIVNLIFKRNVFLSLENIMNVLRQASIVGVVAMGQFFVLISGSIDLSVGSIVGVACIVYAAVFKLGGIEMMPVAFAAALFSGVLMGLINGVLVSYLNITAFIATLGIMLIGRGAIYVATGAYPITGLAKGFAYFGRGLIFGIPVPAIIMFLIAFVTIIIAEKKATGLYMYAIGGNIEAAYLSGIDVRKYKMLALVICGFCCGLGGIILAGRLNSGHPTAGEVGVLFESIIACVIGGVSLAGGIGKAVNVLLGALFITMLANALTLLGVESYLQQVITGVVFIIAVEYDVYRRMRS